MLQVREGKKRVEQCNLGFFFWIFEGIIGEFWDNFFRIGLEFWD